jgi:hypothetical protein
MEKSYDTPIDIEPVTVQERISSEYIITPKGTAVTGLFSPASRRERSEFASRQEGETVRASAFFWCFSGPHSEQTAETLRTMIDYVAGTDNTLGELSTVVVSGRTGPDETNLRPMTAIFVVGSVYMNDRVIDDATVRLVEEVNSNFGGQKFPRLLPVPEQIEQQGA